MSRRHEQILQERLSAACEEERRVREACEAWDTAHGAPLAVTSYTRCGDKLDDRPGDRIRRCGSCSRADDEGRLGDGCGLLLDVAIDNQIVACQERQRSWPEERIDLARALRRAIDRTEQAGNAIDRRCARLADLQRDQLRGGRT